MPNGSRSWVARRAPLLVCAVVALAVALVLVRYFAEGGNNVDHGPSLTLQEIADLADNDLMSRVRVDLAAREMRSHSESLLGTELQPVILSMRFEDAWFSIGLAEAIRQEGDLDVLATAYADLGALNVASCIRRNATRTPAPAELQHVLEQAGTERLRAAWVRKHADAFAGR
jgi:hypothetical protein